MSASCKLRKMDGSGDGEEFGNYDPETRIALEDLETCQKELDTLNERASEEILEVERKYNQLRKPFFDKRNGIIQRIPKFWATAFVSQPELNYLMEEEEDLLQFITKVEVEEFEDIKSGYRISFHFAENPYFENDVLTKEFHLARNPPSESTFIRWKEGKDLTRPNKGAGDASPGRKRAVERRTFLHWFTDNNGPSVDEIAEVIKDELWQNPLHYYLAPVCDVDYTALNGDVDEGDDCDDESQEEEEEAEEEEEVEEDSEEEVEDEEDSEEEDEGESEEEDEDNEEDEGEDVEEAEEENEDSEEAESEEGQEDAVNDEEEGNDNGGEE